MTSFVDLLQARSPDAFAVAASLTADDRAAFVGEIERWLGGVKQSSRAVLLAWIDEEHWPAVIAAAKTALADQREYVKQRAESVLEEAARQVPPLIGADDARVPALHLAFEHGHLRLAQPHPTHVSPPSDAPRLRFGGTTNETCGCCHQALHRLLELHGLELATCLSCLGWEQPLGDYALSYRHDDAGIAHALDRLDAPLAPRFPNAPFAETSIALVDLGPRFYAQDWGAARGANLHRAGGEPTWIQNEDIRACRTCAAPMRVILQLDSELPQADGRTFAFGSGGLLYVQACFACRVTTHLWQCT